MFPSRILEYEQFNCQRCGGLTEARAGHRAAWTKKGLLHRCAECQLTDRREAADARRVLATTLETQAVANLRLMRIRDKRVYVGDAACVGCDCTVRATIRVLRAMERTTGIRCQACRRRKKPPAKTPAPTAIPRSASKLTTATLRTVESLDTPLQKRVNQIVYDHVRACLAGGHEPEELDRVYQEAILVAKMEAVTGEDVPELPRHEPFRRYGQYTSPVGAF